MKANHNCLWWRILLQRVVSNGSKILIWKQITTESFQQHKGYLVVSNGSKILIWKQITTFESKEIIIRSCFQWFKDTNLKANHNCYCVVVLWFAVVSNGSKILIWKQITTYIPLLSLLSSCFQWFKDTNLKANHNSYFIFFVNCIVVSNGSKILIWKQITTCF